jgi:type II secretory pathway pseudopilin PulG
MAAAMRGDRRGEIAGAKARSRESGHLMIALVVALTILFIFSMIASRSWQDVVRRDNEAEMMYRAQEIVRAISKFRKANQGLPNKLEELMEPGPKGEYFLRRLYKDPLVRGGKWGLVYAAPNGGVVDPNSPSADLQPSALGDRSVTPTTAKDALTPGLGGQDATGLPIAGVKCLSKDRPFRVYKGQRDYSLWLFTILDLEPQVPAGAQPSIGDVPGGGEGN